MYQKICPACGAHIDHGARCECGDRHEQIEQELARIAKPRRRRPDSDPEYYDQKWRELHERYCC